jgi:CHASE2 domain-containing sensor protein
MVALFLVGLVLVALAVLPRSRRPVLLLIAGGLLCAAGAAMATNDGFVTLAAGLLPALSGLVVREVADTMRLAGKARRAERRYAERKRLAQQREYERRREERRAA